MAALKQLEVTLSPKMALVRSLPLGLQQLTVRSHLPTDLADLRGRCEKLETLRLINIEKISAFIVADYKKLRHIEVDVRRFQFLNFSELPELISLRVKE